MRSSRERRVLKSQPRRCRNAAIMARAFYPNRSAEVLHISLIPRAYDVLTRDRLRSFRDRALFIYRVWAFISVSACVGENSNTPEQRPVTRSRKITRSRGHDLRYAQVVLARWDSGEPQYLCCSSRSLPSDTDSNRPEPHAIGERKSA
jgi:hypothetical protein